MKALCYTILVLVALQILLTAEGQEATAKDGKFGFVTGLGLNMNGSFLVDMTKKSQRQKRCIVVQKQSGTHGDSNEGPDDPEKPSGEDEGEESEEKSKPKKMPLRKKKRHNNKGQKRTFLIKPVPITFDEQEATEGPVVL